MNASLIKMQKYKDSKSWLCFISTLFHSREFFLRSWISLYSPCGTQNPIIEVSQNESSCDTSTVSIHALIWSDRIAWYLDSSSSNAGYQISSVSQEIWFHVIKNSFMCCISLTPLANNFFFYFPFKHKPH